MSLFAADNADTMRAAVTDALDRALADSRFFDDTAEDGFVSSRMDPSSGHGSYHWRHDRARLAITWTRTEVTVFASIRPEYLNETEALREDFGDGTGGDPQWSRSVEADPQPVHAVLVSALEILAAAVTHGRHSALHPARLAARVCPRCKTEHALEKHTRSTAVEAIDEHGGITIRTVIDPTLVVCSSCHRTWLAPHPLDPDITRPLADLR